MVCYRNQKRVIVEQKSVITTASAITDFSGSGLVKLFVELTMFLCVVYL